jgi:hypothetical protein
VLGIPGLFSTLRLRRSSDLMTIHGGKITLDVVARMVAGLWGEGRARPFRSSSFRCPKAGYSTPANSPATAFRYATATPTVLDSHSRPVRDGICNPVVLRRLASRTDRFAENWPRRRPYRRRQTRIGQPPKFAADDEIPAVGCHGMLEAGHQMNGLPPVTAIVVPEV